MSIKFSAAIWQMSLPMAEKLVALALADQANDSGVCWPSQESVARRTGLSNRSVIRAINALSKAGVLSSQKRLRESNIYRFNSGILAVLISDSVSPMEPSISDTVSPHKCTSVTYDSLYIQTINESSSIKSRDYKTEAKEVLEFLNRKTGKAFRCVDTNLRPIIERLKSGIEVQDCKTVIARKHRDWSKDPKMSGYLRPATLFRASNFESYLGECVL